MKECIHKKKYREKYFPNKIRCRCTGTIRRECKLRECRYFYPTLMFKLFGKWWERGDIVTKKELKEIYYIDKEIKMWQSKLDEMTEVQSPNLTGLPGSNMTSDMVSRLAVQKDEINMIISGLLVKLEVRKREITEYIESISDSVIRQIIQYRYIDLLTWIKISEKIYGRIDRESSVRMIHDRFLKK